MYSGLTALYEKYKKDGLEILGFPCGQFMEQEFQDPEEINRFATNQYMVTFPLFWITEVNGPNAHPVFKYLKLQNQLAPATLVPSKDPNSPIKHYKVSQIPFNFTKFLLNNEGKVIQTLYPNSPLEELEENLKKLLYEGNEEGYRPPK